MVLVGLGEFDQEGGPLALGEAVPHLFELREGDVVAEGEEALDEGAEARGAVAFEGVRRGRVAGRDGFVEDGLEKLVVARGGAVARLGDAEGGEVGALRHAVVGVEEAGVGVEDAQGRLPAEGAVEGVGVRDGVHEGAELGGLDPLVRAGHERGEVFLEEGLVGQGCGVFGDAPRDEHRLRVAEVVRLREGLHVRDDLGVGEALVGGGVGLADGVEGGVDVALRRLRRRSRQKRGR